MLDEDIINSSTNQNSLNSHLEFKIAPKDNMILYSGGKIK
jgi:hypothetical protein